MINVPALLQLPMNFHEARPFQHFCVDGFFEPEVYAKIETEFPALDAPIWHRYGNALENKSACNNWNEFGPTTYSVLAFLNSPAFLQKLGILTGIAPLYADPGLSGGGLHSMSNGGRLNPHLDFARHSKTGFARKLNLIIYIGEWEESWGGSLGMWSGDEDGPRELVKEIHPKPNRAVIFDTQGSWHGLPSLVNCPEGKARRSLAVYYMTEPAETLASRTKALYAPTPEQANDPEIEALIKRRANGVYA